jgi:hypothetical protein
MQLTRVRYYADRKVILDENQLVRNTWSFLCVGLQFSGSLWSTSGLSKFELAHCLSHKSDELLKDGHHFTSLPTDGTQNALFTCATNVALIPKGMAKPTDATGRIRAAFLHRYHELYGNQYARSYAGFDLKKSIPWIDQLKWRPPLRLPSDWIQRVDRLDRYRRKLIPSLLSGKTIEQADAAASMDV